jgi:hypothetical protein
MTDGELLRLHCYGRCGSNGQIGWLVVEPGTVRWEIGETVRRWILAPPVIHADPPLTVKRARLLAFGHHTGVVLRGREGVVCVVLAGGHYREAWPALVASGVEMVQERTWLRIGIREGIAGNPSEMIRWPRLRLRLRRGGGRRHDEYSGEEIVRFTGDGEPRLRVYCPARCGRHAGGGWLVIERGRVSFEIDASHRRGDPGPPVIHADAPVTLKWAHWEPWGIRGGLVLRSPEAVVTAYLTPDSYAQVRPALLASEIAVNEETSWFSIGFMEGLAGNPNENHSWVRPRIG